MALTILERDLSQANTDITKIVVMDTRKILVS